MLDGATSPGGAPENSVDDRIAMMMLGGVHLQPDVVAAEGAGFARLGRGHVLPLDADVRIALKRAGGRIRRA